MSKSDVGGSIAWRGGGRISAGAEGLSDEFGQTSDFARNKQC